MPGLSCTLHMLPYWILTIAIWRHFFFFYFPPLYGSINWGPEGLYITWPKLHSSKQQARDFHSICLIAYSFYTTTHSIMLLNQPLCLEFTVYTSKWMNDMGVTDTDMQILPWHPPMTSMIWYQSWYPNSSPTVFLHKSLHVPLWILKMPCLCFCLGHFLA